VGESASESLAIWLPALGGGLLGIGCLWASMRARRKRRLLDDLPTSRAQGVFIGFVELKGTAEARHPLSSFLAEEPCVYYAWEVEEHWRRTVTESYTDTDGKRKTRTRTESGWTTVAEGGEMISFPLRDETGTIRVVPSGATIEPLTLFEASCGEEDPLYYAKGPPEAVAHSTYERRFSEEAIPVGTPLYVVGQAREREDVVAPEIASDPQAPMFLISTRRERDVGRGLGARSWGWWILGLALAAGGAAWHGARPGGSPLGEPALAFGAYLAAWTLAWVWMAYNSLVDLRHRVRQAWSLVDIQLKRRNDLVPNLVACVRGFRDHESALQSELAELRTQLEATPPGDPGPDPRACAPVLRAVVERYPDLKAQESFLRLQEELVDTEERIALARAYFNDVASFFNTRLEVVPDRFVARLAGLRPRKLMEAGGFERARGE
jgi:hypothetical protein